MSDYHLVKKEYKNRHDWVRKMIHWKLCKRLKFNAADQWCMNKQKSVVGNETDKIFWDFKVKRDGLKPVRKSENVN